MKKKQAFNPYLPGYEYIPDAEPHVFGDRVYIYGSHDRFAGDDFCLNDYVCYSANIHDLSDWRYEGVIYRRDADPDNQDGRLCLWAPDVVQGQDGKFYLYYCLSRERRLRVAVCDSPAGEYRFLGKVRYPDGTELGTKEGDYQEFDPGVFVDDDGTVYIYSGITFMELYPERRNTFNPVKASHVVTLEADMLTVKTGQKKILPSIFDSQGTGFEGHEFFEASSVRKINGRYYYVYSSKNSMELCYAVSEKPDEDFRYGGTIIALGDVGLSGRTREEALNFYMNTHGGMVQINGQWYIFYHRQTNRHQYSRQACAERIEILPDGSIPQVEMTSCGLNGGPLKGEGIYEARIACNLMGSYGATISREKEQTDAYPFFTQDGADRDPEQGEPYPTAYIANIRNGAVVGFKYFDIQGVKKLSVNVRRRNKGSTEGYFQITDTLHGNDCGKVPIKLTDRGCAGSWEEFSGEVNIPDGVRALYFEYRGDGALDFVNFTLSR